MYAVIGPKNFIASGIRKKRLNTDGTLSDSDYSMNYRLCSTAEDLLQVSSLQTGQGPLSVRLGGVSISLPRFAEDQSKKSKVNGWDHPQMDPPRNAFL